MVWSAMVRRGTARHGTARRGAVRRAKDVKRRLDRRHRWSLRGPWGTGEYWLVECLANRCIRNPSRSARALYLIPSSEITEAAIDNLTGTKFTLTPLNLALPGTGA